MATHRHKAASEQIRGYMGGVAGPLNHQEPRAAGGICVVETCSCGAVRKTNQNQGYRETSGWVRPSTLNLRAAAWARNRALQ